MYFAMDNRGNFFNEPRWKNTGILSYNCGAYAFGLGEGYWFLPYITPSRFNSELYFVEDEVDYLNEREKVDERKLERAKEKADYWHSNYDWVIEGFTDSFYDCFGHYPSEDEEMELEEWDSEICIDFAIYIMLHNFSWLRVVKSFDELYPDEYGIIFGVGNGDFHFVRYEDKKYSHKAGSRKIESLTDWEKGFCYEEDSSEVKYDKGYVFLAAIKESCR